MNRQKLIEDLEHICEDANSCGNCIIGKSQYGPVYCINHEFQNMSDVDLILYAEAAGIEILEEDPVKPEEDPVNHPNHYTSGGIECIDAIAASMTPIEYAGFLKGQVLKYVWRYRLKGKPVEDLKKARFYLDRLIQSAEKEEVSV